MKLRCVIIDDEPVARNGLAEDIRAIDFMEVAGLAENALHAMEILTKQNPDLIFLDIEMPKLNGFDLLHSLDKPPMVILTTAYSHYAPESYDAGVIDYLLKPISFDRLMKACHKARELINPATETPDFFFVKSNNRYEKILVSELLYVEAADNYIFIYAAGKKYLVYRTLKSMEELLPAHRFIKVHKSFIIAFDKVDSFEGNSLFIGGNCIPLSRNYREMFITRMGSK